MIFTSHFSALDMKEALNGTPGDSASWKDYGYFGLLHADFDENGMASGTYSPKLSYRAMQHLTRLFPADTVPRDLPVIRKALDSPRIFGRDDSSPRIVMLGFANGRGEALAYWKAADLMTETFEGTVSFSLPGEEREIRLIDLLNGGIYALPDSMIDRTEEGAVMLRNLPLTDVPLLLTFGAFAG